MAAMMGCGQRSISRRKSTRLRASRNWVGTGGSRNSRMSAPAEKALSPAPGHDHRAHRVVRRAAA